MKHIIFVSFAWIVIGIAIAMTSIALCVHLNFFSWNPNLDSNTMIWLLLGIIGLIATPFAARNSLVTAEYLFSFAVSISLTALGIFLFFDIQNQTLGISFFRRERLSPTWFRYAILFFLFWPALNWVYYPLLRWRKSQRE